MSRCPPPLGPMSWAGRSSICRASSPTVSVLPRQERPHRQKRSIKRGAGLAGPAGHAGQHGTQSQSWHGGGDRRVWPEAAGVRLGASKRYSCGAAPLPTAAAISPGSRRGRQMCEGGASPGHWALSPLLLQLCLEWGWYTRAFCLPSSLAMLLSFSLSVSSSSSFPSFFVLFPLYSLAWC